MTKPSLSIVIPVFNERDNILPIIQSLHETFNKGTIDWEVIIVDDNSPDKTWQTAKTIASSDKHVRVIRRIGRKGLSSAVIEGMLSSSSTYLAVMDGDGQHDEKLLPLMVEHLETDSDIVVASRFVSGGSSSGLSSQGRVTLSRSANKAANLVLNVKTTDPMTGFFALKRQTIETIVTSFSGSGFKILFDILARVPKSTRLTELPLNFRQRLHGESKLNFKIFLCGLKQLVFLSLKRFKTK